MRWLGLGRLSFGLDLACYAVPLCLIAVGLLVVRLGLGGFWGFVVLSILFAFPCFIFSPFILFIITLVFYWVWF